MLEFLRDSLLCSTEDSPKHEVPKRHSSRYAVCCGGGQSQPRRRAEVISSQGEPKLAPKDVHGAGAGVSGKPSGGHGSATNNGSAWDQMASARTPSPLRTRGNAANGRGLSPLRSGSGSFLSTSSFHSNFGSSVPFSAAAMGTGDMCRGGLYVPVQRGLGPRSSQRDGLGLRGEASSRHRKEEKYMRCSSRLSMPLRKYRPVLEDPVDVAFARAASELSSKIQDNLLVRRIGQGEYEVDGKVVRVRLLGQDLVVYTQTLGTSEMLGPFMRRLADKHAPGHQSAKTAMSFDLSDPTTRVMTGGTSQQLGSANGSFMLRGGDGGSFLLNRSEAASFTTSVNGSFYGNHALNTTASMVQSPLGPPRQQRVHRQTPSTSSSAVFASRGATNVGHHEGNSGSASRALSPATAGITTAAVERSPSGRLAIGLPPGRPGLNMHGGSGLLMPQSPYSKHLPQHQHHGLPPHGVTPPMPNVIRQQQGYPGGRVFACTSPPVGGQGFPPPPMVGGMGPPTPVATVRVAAGSANKGGDEGGEAGTAPSEQKPQQQQQQQQSSSQTSPSPWPELSSILKHFESGDDEDDRLDDLEGSVLDDDDMSATHLGAIDQFLAKVDKSGSSVGSSVCRELSFGDVHDDEQSMCVQRRVLPAESLSPPLPTFVAISTQRTSPHYIARAGDLVDQAMAKFLNQPSNRFRRSLVSRWAQGEYLVGTLEVHVALDISSGELLVKLAARLDAQSGHCPWIFLEDFFRLLENRRPSRRDRKR
mmetsp:Transcript_57251/g.125341  ORF Transcript_57251/g.125341 Transcript_57251/m.125341 type:complete len:758 (+) Transcript_57251:100-2373(+)